MELEGMAEFEAARRTLKTLSAKADYRLYQAGEVDNDPDAFHDASTDKRDIDRQHDVLRVSDHEEIAKIRKYLQPEAEEWRKFETARDTIAQMRQMIRSNVGEELANSGPATERIEELRKQDAKLRREYEELDPYDPAEFARIRSEYGPRAEEWTRKQQEIETALSKPAPLIPGYQVPDLTDTEIAARLSRDEQLQFRRSEINRLSQIVYGRPGDGFIASIDASPAEGRAAGVTIASDVNSATTGRSPLAGETRTWLRKESPDRQEAVDQAPDLASVIAGYGRMVEYTYDKIIAQHQEDQKRQRQEVPAPSVGLSGVLRAPAEDQLRRLSERPALAEELKELTRAFTQRLAPDDFRAIRTGDDEGLGRSLSVPREAARTVAELHKHVAEVNRTVQVRAQTLSHSQGGPVLRRALSQ